MQPTRKGSSGGAKKPMQGNGPSMVPAVTPPTPLAMRNCAHFPSGQQLQTTNSPTQGCVTDCMICSKPFEPIADEIVIDFIYLTEYPGSPLCRRSKKKGIYRKHAMYIVDQFVNNAI